MSARVHWLAPGLLLGIAAALRLWGIGWGLPDSTHLFSYHPDEFHSLRGVLSLSQGDLNPHFFNYGSLYLYLVSALCVVAHGGLVFGLDIGTIPEAIRTFTLDARIVSVACGVATVYVAHLIGVRLAGRRAGLAAGTALAVMPLHVLDCHYGTVDVTQTLFVSLCLLFTLMAVGDGGLKPWALAGAMAGLAASVKYNGILVMVAPAVGLVAARLRVSEPAERARGGPRLHIAALACLAAAVAAFCLTSPYTILAWAEAKKDIFFELGHMRAGEADALLTWPNGWLFHLHWAVFLLPLAFALASPEARRGLAPLLGFGALWYVIISLAKVRYARYGVPLELLAAVALGALCGGLRPVQWGGVALVLAGALCLVWSGMSAQHDTVLARPLPQDRMLARVLKEVPPGESVGMVFEPWFGMPPVDYCNGGAALRGNPLWGQFKRPQREVVVTGMDAQRILAAKPYAFLTSDFDGEPLTAGDPAAREVKRMLTAHYQERAYEVSAWVQGDVFKYPPASDLRYAHPIIHLYVRNQTP